MHAMDQLEDDLMSMGYEELVVKSDQEPSILALKNAMKQRCCSYIDIVPEESPRYDSQSNGGTEVGVMLIRGLFRTLKLALESKIEKHTPIGHALVPWLIEHTALLLTVKSRGADGLTAWARCAAEKASLQ